MKKFGSFTILLELQKIVVASVFLKRNVAGTCSITTFLIHCYLIWAATWRNQQSECAPSEDSDQPGHPPSLIRVFAVRMKKPWVLSLPLSAQRRLWSGWSESSLGAHSLCWFCHEAAHMLYSCVIVLHICVIVMIVLYSVFHNMLNLSAACMESVLYKGNTISHAVIQGYGICMYASALFLNGWNFD